MSRVILPSSKHCCIKRNACNQKKVLNSSEFSHTKAVPDFVGLYETFYSPSLLLFFCISSYWRTVTLRDFVLHSQKAARNYIKCYVWTKIFFSKHNVYDMNICDALHVLVPFVQSKKHKKHPWRSVTFDKIAGFCRL